LHDKICDPDFSPCGAVEDFAEESSPAAEQAAMYWGIMSIVMFLISMQISLSAGGGLFYFSLGSLGW